MHKKNLNVKLHTYRYSKFTQKKENKLSYKNYYERCSLFSIYMFNLYLLSHAFN